MTRVYYKEAHGAFIVFDVTRDETFDLAQRWKNDIDNKVTLPNGDPIPVVLLANKVRTDAAGPHAGSSLVAVQTDGPRDSLSPMGGVRRRSATWLD